MPRDVARDALYSGQINLWVEDDLTRAYLSALWNDSAVKFLIGGGRDGVIAILRDAEVAGYRNVFGVIDRDHGRSNHRVWLARGRRIRTFVLPRHEIENYLLDTSALQGCKYNTQKRSILEIDALLDQEVGRRCWWSACCLVVSLIRNRVHHQFIKHPTTPPVSTEQDANDHIVKNSCFQKLPRRSLRITPDCVRKVLLCAHARALKMRLDGRWRTEFSGKEILREIGNKIARQAPGPHGNQPSKSEFASDLAKHVAKWQVENQKIPADLSDLLTALKAQIAIEPSNRQ